MTIVNKINKLNTKQRSVEPNQKTKHNKKKMRNQNERSKITNEYGSFKSRKPYSCKVKRHKTQN